MMYPKDTRLEVDIRVTASRVDFDLHEPFSEPDFVDATRQPSQVIDTIKHVAAAERFVHHISYKRMPMC